MTTYIHIVAVEELGSLATPEELADFCRYATHATGITTRPVRPGEVTGLYELRGGIATGPDLLRMEGDDAYPELQDILDEINHAGSRWPDVSVTWNAGEE